MTFMPASYTLKVKHLYKDPLGLHSETTRMEKWASGRTIEYCSKQLLEVLVLEGKAVVDGEKLGKCHPLLKVLILKICHNQQQLLS